jgi:hypothetical protein
MLQGNRECCGNRLAAQVGDEWVLYDNTIFYRQKKEESLSTLLSVEV